MEATLQKMGPPGTGAGSTLQLICGRAGQRVLKEAAISGESQPFRLLMGKEKCIHSEEQDVERPLQTNRGGKRTKRTQANK